MRRRRSQRSSLPAAGWCRAEPTELDTPLRTEARVAPVLRGMAEGCVRLIANFATGDIVALDNPDSSLISDVTLGTLVQRQSGAVFHQMGGYNTTYRNITITGPQAADGWLLDGSNTVFLEDYKCRPPSPDHREPAGLFWAGACIHLVHGTLELHATNGTAAAWHYGLELTDTGGATVSFADFTTSGNAVLFDPSNARGETVWGISLTGVYGDSSAGDNWLFAGTGPITDVKIVDGWASNSQTANGYAFTNALTNGVQLDIPDVLNNFAAGFAIAAGTNIQINGPEVMMNSQQGANMNDGVFIGAAAGNVTLMGGHCGQGGHMAAPDAKARAPGAIAANKQRWCVNQAPGAAGVQSVKVIGLTTINNVSGGINLQANGPHYADISLGNTGN